MFHGQQALDGVRAGLFLIAGHVDQALEHAELGLGPLFDGAALLVFVLLVIDLGHDFLPFFILLHDDLALGYCLAQGGLQAAQQGVTHPVADDRMIAHLGQRVLQDFDHALGIGLQVGANLADGGLDGLGDFLLFDQALILMRLEQVFALGNLLHHVAVLGLDFFLVELGQEDAHFVGVDAELAVLLLQEFAFAGAVFQLSLDHVAGQGAVFEGSDNLDAGLVVRHDLPGLVEQLHRRIELVVMDGQEGPFQQFLVVQPVLHGSEGQGPVGPDQGRLRPGVLPLPGHADQEVVIQLRGGYILGDGHGYRIIPPGHDAVDGAGQRLGRLHAADD